MSVSVLGAGAFGTALAIALAKDGQPITLWSRNPKHVRQMQAARENAAYLPGHGLPHMVEVTDDIAEACRADTLLLAVPTQHLRGVLTEHRALLGTRRLVACCKGIELDTGLGPVSIIRDVCPEAPAAILTGPSFAHDIAAGLPTALTLAASTAEAAQVLQAQLSRPALRLYRTTDTIGAELGGALKNVIAIACGAADGAGLGHSARAALMTRGYAEMQRMALAQGARIETLAGLSGFGDLALTCGSAGSRNFRFGHALARAADWDPGVTVEGAATARAALADGRKRGVDLPITQAVVALLDGKGVADIMTELLNRPLKEE